MIEGHRGRAKVVTADYGGSAEYVMTIRLIRKIRG